MYDFGQNADPEDDSSTDTITPTATTLTPTTAQTSSISNNEQSYQSQKHPQMENDSNIDELNSGDRYGTQSKVVSNQNDEDSSENKKNKNDCGPSFFSIYRKQNSSNATIIKTCGIIQKETCEDGESEKSIDNRMKPSDEITTLNINFSESAENDFINDDLYTCNSAKKKQEFSKEWYDLHQNDMFPEICLQEFERMIEKFTWREDSPVYSPYELLIESAIKTLQADNHQSNKACQYFLNETVINFFNSRISDNLSFSHENYNRLVSILFKLIELIVLCIKKRQQKTVELLSQILSLKTWFANLIINENSCNDSMQYTNQSPLINQNILLCLMINYFGQMGGFDALMDCFQDENLNIHFMIICFNPFIGCIDYLSLKTLETYFLPIIKKVPDFFENLPDEEFKKEIKFEQKYVSIINLIAICEYFLLKMSNSEVAKSFNFLRLKLLLRMLQLSPFNGKMNALNEINKIILRSAGDEDSNFPQLPNVQYDAEELAKWLIDNNVLEIVLKDCLHQPQYVEKLENIIRFLLKQNALTIDCLDKIWNSQQDKHEIIVKNIHDLIAKLAWSFSPDQLNHLFLNFKSSWMNAAIKEKEKLLELMRRMAEDDKDGSMANKVLTLLWNIAYNDDEVDNDIVDQSLSAHLKILDYRKNFHRDYQKNIWLERCIEEIIKSDYGNNVITAMKQIRDICLLFPTNQIIKPIRMLSNSKFSKPNKNRQSRTEILTSILNKYNFVPVLIKNLVNYMEWIRDVFIKSNGSISPTVVRPGRRFSHCQEIQGRLDFFKFFLQEGQFWLGSDHADEIWNCLAQNAIFPYDRQICFNWFSSIMDFDSDLDPDIYVKFFESNIIKLDPTLVDINGVECFEKFFKAVNIKQEKLIIRNQTYLMQDSDLIGLDYLWKLILFCEDQASSKAINLLKECYTNLGHNLIDSQVELHHDLINTCFDRLKASYDTVTVIEHDNDSSKAKVELGKMARVLLFLCEYILKCDEDFKYERTILPMSQSFRGKPVIITLKIVSGFPKSVEEYELRTHTNESWISIKNRILSSSNMGDLEFYDTREKIDFNRFKTVGQYSNERKLILTAKTFSANPISCSSEYEITNQYDQDIIQKLEHSLPGVIMSQNSYYTNFLFKIADLAMSLKYDTLRKQCLTILGLIPPDQNYIDLMRKICTQQPNSNEENYSFENFDSEFLSSPTKTVYLLGIINVLLLPANLNLYGMDSNFQTSFISKKFFLKIIDFLIDKNFLGNADNLYKIHALNVIFKITKYSLLTICFLKMYSSPPSDSLTDTLKFIPNDLSIKNVALTVAQIIYKNGIEDQLKNELIFIPNKDLIYKVLMVAWFNATGNSEFTDETDGSVLHEYFLKNYSQINESKKLYQNGIYDLCNEALELSTILFLLDPGQVPFIVEDKKWHDFIIDLLLLCPEESIRNTMVEQLTIILTKCSYRPLILVVFGPFLDLLFHFLKNVLPVYYQTSQQFCQFFCNILEFGHQNRITFDIVDDLLEYEYNLLRNPKENFFINSQVVEILLEGSLKITKELIMFSCPKSKYLIGCSQKPSQEIGLVDLLFDKYLFTASKLMSLIQQNQESGIVDDIYPVCCGSRSLIAAYDLVVALCDGCVENLLHVCQNLETYMSTFSVFSQWWEYFPTIGTRPPQGFVGLKNAGATCYMNSVIQQLFMIPEVRNGILSVMIDFPYRFYDSNDENPFFNNENKMLYTDDSKTYNIRIFQQIQIIFGHLLLSQCQYYVPEGFWRTFKFFGGPMNLREQQDALEFFNSLFDCLDEALKDLGKPLIMSNIFGGLFSDQKICKDCPHRYCREESFTHLNVDIGNHNSLMDSLEQYVRGDLLEGDNAYRCEKCDRKVNTVKRLCIKKLPKVLVIQLKRFDYDYERETSVKSNSYFEFPRNLDMEPYTVNGLARKEGEIIEDLVPNDVTCYELTGIVVHSGQSNGGHYYSFVRHQTDDGLKKWYRFDDTEVSECRLDQDEEMRNQCFGGEYFSDVYDQILKKVTPKLQKRWWNAFILVYRQSNKENEKVDMIPSMPLPIRRNVQNHNIVFMHQKTMFSEEFYHFMKCLLECNVKNLNLESSTISSKLDNIVIATLRLAAKFLFSFCFRTKKSLRCSALDWYETILPYLKTSSRIRNWFIKEYLLSSRSLIYEFLLECPAQDVRMAFMKIIILLCHYCLLEKESSESYADEIIAGIVKLIEREVLEAISHSAQYFHLFYSYIQLGFEERLHLLKHRVPFYFLLFACDLLCMGPTIKGQYIDNNHLFQVISILIRCYDISEAINVLRKDSDTQSILPNPYRFEDNNDYKFPIPDDVYKLLYLDQKYVKKILKEAVTMDENVKLLKFCSWENQFFSRSLIDNILLLLNNPYSYEMQPIISILPEILLLEDSVQRFRVFWTLIRNDLTEKEDSARKGLLEMICGSKFGRKAYTCLELLVKLFKNSKNAAEILKSDQMLLNKWRETIEYCQNELSKKINPVYYLNNAYPGTNSGANWPQLGGMNNDFSSKQILDINMARKLLEEAFELFGRPPSEPSLEAPPPPAPSPSLSEPSDETATNITDNEDEVAMDDVVGDDSGNNENSNNKTENCQSNNDKSNNTANANDLKPQQQFELDLLSHINNLYIASSKQEEKEESKMKNDL